MISDATSATIANSGIAQAAIERRSVMTMREIEKAIRKAKRSGNYKPDETVADFKQRIAIMMRERETGKKYSVVGASRAHECVVRCPDHRNGGATFCPRGGAALQMWQRKQWGD